MYYSHVACLCVLNLFKGHKVVLVVEQMYVDKADHLTGEEEDEKDEVGEKC